jgi:hypothetical protein
VLFAPVNKNVEGKSNNNVVLAPEPQKVGYVVKDDITVLPVCGSRFFGKCITCPVEFDCEVKE